MNRLTRQEQFVLVSVLALLVVGLGVKVYRVAYPRQAAVTVTVSAKDHSTNTPAEPKE